jgi:hypothetical protein
VHERATLIPRHSANQISKLRSGAFEPLCPIGLNPAITASLGDHERNCPLADL